VMMMLRFHEPGRKRPLAVLVDVDDTTDASTILLARDLLAGEKLPDRVAHPFGSVGVAFGFDVSIEVLQ